MTLARRTQDDQIENFTMSYRQRLIDQGREEGREQDREEGRAGVRDILRKLLQFEFGDIDASTEERLAEAGLAQLARWSDRVLDADSLEGVFESS